MTDPLGPVVITSREIYDQLVRVGTAITELAAQIGRIGDGVDEVKRDVADHEGRLRSLERSRWPLPSLAAVVSVAALAVSIIILVKR